MRFQWINLEHNLEILWLKTERNRVDFTVENTLNILENIAVKQVAHSSTRSTSLQTTCSYLVMQKKGSPPLDRKCS